MSGSYETLIKVSLRADRSPDDVRLEWLEIETTTMLNSKTQPRLRLGRNQVYVGLGNQTDSIVLWPDLRADRYQPYVVEERNIAAQAEHPGYMGVMHAARPNAEAYVVFRVDAPQPITEVTYGGRFYNRAPRAEIGLEHSFDEGRTWQTAYTLRDTAMPWDVIHYERIGEIPADTRSVLLKYRLRASAAGPNACSIYSARVEVNHSPGAPGFRPIDVTFDWSEVQPDRSLQRRIHTQRIDRVPFRYPIDVGGADHPVVNSLRVNLAGALPDLHYGDSDGQEAGGTKFVDRWVSYGPNVLEGRPYTVSAPPTGQWDGADPEGKKLTDGVVGPPYAGGIAPRYGGIWDARSGELEITVDMGQPDTIAACGMHLTAGWPWWDALRGEVQDEIEVLTSRDGSAFQSQGKMALNLWRKDIPVNHLLPDEETARSWNYVHRLAQPTEARWVRFKLLPKRAVAVTEVQAFKWVKEEPFDLRIALPDDEATAEK